MQSDELSPITLEPGSEIQAPQRTYSPGSQGWRFVAVAAALAAAVAVTAAVGAHREVDRQRESASNVVKALASAEGRLVAVEGEMRDLEAELANVKATADARDVPDVVGLRLDEALAVLASAGLDAVIPDELDPRKASAVVVAQNPQAGESLPRRSAVELDLR